MDLIVFVVASIYYDGRMVAHSAKVRNGLLPNGFEESGKCWVISATEHEVLPDHNAEFVTCIIECVVFVNASAPHSEALLVSIGRWGRFVTYLIMT